MDFRQRFSVETPEQVLLDYEVAGVGSRALAALIDMMIVIVLSAALLFLAWMVASRIPGVPVQALYLVLQFAVIWGYFALFEGLREGQTPGKKRVGIRVVRDTGHGITFQDALVRNLVRVADFLPPPYLLGAVCVAVHPQGKRLGDLVAGTVVVRDKPVEAGSALRFDAPHGTSGAPLLADEEVQVLRQFIERSATLPVDVRDRLARSLVARFVDRAPMGPGDDIAYLLQLLAGEEARRRGTFAAAGHRRSGHTAAGTLVARKDARWREFEALATQATRAGLGTLDAESLVDFAARYREASADLARTRTYRAEAGVRARLERIVALGHNLLYRSERRGLRDLGRFVALGAPSAIVAARWYVLVAFLAFAAPALAGYRALRQLPARAESGLPAVLLERAEEGLERKRAGLGYGEAPPGERATVASAIVTNNVQVAFMCFASGVFFGVGSLALLAFNGLLIGATSGHYHNLGLLDYLWTFVAGHGVLELFAIWVAGAAGLVIGTAIVRPGPWTRRDALAHRGALAGRMVGACIILLVVAGAIEGFLSTSRVGAPVKVAVSGASAAILLLWLWLGARFHGQAMAPAATTAP